MVRAPLLVVVGLVLGTASSTLAQSDERARAHLAPEPEPTTQVEPAEVEPAEAEPAEVEPAALPPGRAEPPVERSRPDSLGTVGLVVGGLGVAALLGAIGTGIASQSTYDALVLACPEDVCPPERHDDIDEGRALATASTALLVAGAVALAVGLTFLVIDLADGGEEAGARVALVPAPGGVVVAGRF